MKEEELERKADIKEKEQATSKKADAQSEPVSTGALEDNQDQRDPGAETERLWTEANGEDKGSVPDGNIKSSLRLNDDDLTLGSKYGDNFDL